MDVLVFRLFLSLERRLFAEELGAEAFTRLRRDAVTILRELLPRVPDTGGPGARLFLVVTCYLVAVHRALPERPVHANAELFSRALGHLLGRVPRPLRRARRWVFFQPWYYRRLLASIVGTPRPSVPGFVGDVVAEGPGRFGVDYSQCAIQHFLGAIGARELGPYVCALDFVESEAFELGLVRTGTLATGAKRCDFRWTRAP